MSLIRLIDSSSKSAIERPNCIHRKRVKLIQPLLRYIRNGGIRMFCHDKSNVLKHLKREQIFLSFRPAFAMFPYMPFPQQGHFNIPDKICVCFVSRIFSHLRVRWSYYACWRYTWLIWGIKNCRQCHSGSNGYVQQTFQNQFYQNGSIRVQDLYRHFATLLRPLQTS